MNERHEKPVEAEVRDRTAERPQTPYRRPEMFEVAGTAQLIQGAFWRGPRDHPNSWPIYNL